MFKWRRDAGCAVWQGRPRHCQDRQRQDSCVSAAPGRARRGTATRAPRGEPGRAVHCTDPGAGGADPPRSEEVRPHPAARRTVLPQRAFSTLVYMLPAPIRVCAQYAIAQPACAVLYA